MAALCEDLLSGKEKGTEQPGGFGGTAFYARRGAAGVRYCAEALK